jgi:hypothetical protein
MFELFLAISSALMSANLSIISVTKLHWIFFGVTFFSSMVFLALSLWFGKRARMGR